MYCFRLPSPPLCTVGMAGLDIWTQAGYRAGAQYRVFVFCEPDLGVTCA